MNTAIIYYSSTCTVHALARAVAEGAEKADGQVVVEAAATAVNPFDVVLSSGTFVGKPALPCVAGSDGTGRHGSARRKTLIRI